MNSVWYMSLVPPAFWIHLHGRGASSASHQKPYPWPIRPIRAGSSSFPSGPLSTAHQGAVPFRRLPDRHSSKRFKQKTLAVRWPGVCRRRASEQPTSSSPLLAGPLDGNGRLSNAAQLDARINQSRPKPGHLSPKLPNINSAPY